MFAGLWCEADRAGRLEDRPRKLKAALLPYDDCDVDNLLGQLEKQGLIKRYAADGQHYIAVLEFAKHQNPHVREPASSIPAPVLHQTSTVQAPDSALNGHSPARLIPDSLLLIPDSLQEHEPYGSTNQQADPHASGLELVSGSEKPAAARASQKILDAYHAILPNCARIEVLGDKRLRQLQLADKQARKVCRDQNWVYDAEVFWSEFFTECSRDPWLRGDVPNPKNAQWKQSLMILIREEHFSKVMDAAIAEMRKAVA